MIQLRGHLCCGAAELHGLNDEGWTVRKYLTYYVQEYEININPKVGKAFLTFSYAWDVGRAGNGLRTTRQGKIRLAKWKAFIEDNKLGRVVIMPKCSFNPNYGTTVRIRAGIWVPDNQAIHDFVIAKKWMKGPSLAKKLHQAVWEY